MNNFFKRSSPLTKSNINWWNLGLEGSSKTAPIDHMTDIKVTSDIIYSISFGTLQPSSSNDYI